MTAALVALLHVLVFVYWLGGDLGAFYTSSIVSDPRRSRDARVAAAQALADLDMAPRTSLILAFPTGLTLAVVKGWAALPPAALAAVWLVMLAWLWLAWRIHRHHLTPANFWRRLDLIVRWSVLTGLTLLGVAVLWELLAWPFFLGLKLLILAAAIAAGLWVRVLLAPFGPAFSAWAVAGPTPEGDAVIARTLSRVRPAVMAIWTLLLAAALIGYWKPA